MHNCFNVLMSSPGVPDSYPLLSLLFPCSFLRNCSVLCQPLPAFSLHLLEIPASPLPPCLAQMAPKGGPAPARSWKGSGASLGQRLQRDLQGTPGPGLGGKPKQRTFRPTCPLGLRFTFPFPRKPRLASRATSCAAVLS